MPEDEELGRVRRRNFQQVRLPLLHRPSEARMHGGLRAHHMERQMYQPNPQLRAVRGTDFLEHRRAAAAGKSEIGRDDDVEHCHGTVELRDSTPCGGRVGYDVADSVAARSRQNASASREAPAYCSDT
jgi:hypothetical protein